MQNFKSSTAMVSLVPRPHLPNDREVGPGNKASYGYCVMLLHKEDEEEDEDENCISYLV